MFRSSTIIKELALKGKLPEDGVLHAVHSVQHATHTPFLDMLPHNRITNNDIISSNVLT